MIVLEACVTTASEAEAAFDEGASRVELCRDLERDGLSPSDREIAETVERVPGPVVVMVRPTMGDFRVTAAQIDTMVSEIHGVRERGAHGVVLGVLDRSGRIDRTALGELVAAAGDLPVTFHRAFDRLDDPVDGVHELMRAGVRRVLTSGGARTAWEGRTILTELVRAAGDQLVVLGGGRVRGDHVRTLVQITGLREVHARAHAIAGLAAALA